MIHNSKQLKKFDFLETPIEINKKNVKNLSLKITNDSKIICTSPFYFSDNKIFSFIESKKMWIIKNYEKQKFSVKNSQFLNQNGIAKLSGLSEKDRIKGESNFKYSKKWKELSLKNFEIAATKYLPFFEVGTLPQFSIKGRAMHSMWGNCNTKTATITLNYELLNFPQKVLEYVVLHEMTHFLFIYHDKNFYNFIKKIMGDYKEIQNFLKS